MSWPGPSRSTGTSEDLFSILIRADENRVARDGWPVPAKNVRGRAVIEPFLNLLARGLGSAALALPADWMLRVYENAFKSLASPHSHPVDASERFERAAALARRLGAGGEPPALVALISHGPVRGELAYMNFELVRHAMAILRRLRGRPCRPRLVIAVDPFALDTVSLAGEALYAGFMGRCHLGIDRAAAARGVLSRRIVAPAAWHRMPLRLLAHLSRGGEMGMALAGGIETTTRVRYAAREWLSLQRTLSPLARDPAAAAARLAGFGDYAAFAASRPALIHRASVWRRMEAWLMCALEEPSLSGGRDPSSAERGTLEESARAVALACLEALGVRGGRASAALEALAEEFARRTPYRRRFFRLVARRVLRRGRPVVFLPLCHRAGPEPCAAAGASIRLGEAWAWTGFEEGAGRGGAVRALAASGASRETGVDDFARDFVRENFD